MKPRLSGALSRVRRVLLVVSAVGFAATAYAYVTLPDVRNLATSNPETTAFMELRRAEAVASGKRLRHLQQWVPYSRISPNLKRAVLAAEDSAFWEHEGIDLEQIRESIRVSLERGTPVRGASTITQQLAKNLYLSPSRDPTRKVQELIISRRLEAELSKTRIFEIYLNVIEWGDGVWGAEAAARTYFGVSAMQLSRSQAALLAGAIINPRQHSPAKPRARLLRRQRIILARMGGDRAAPTVETEQAPLEPVPPAESLLEDDEVVDDTVEEGAAEERAVEESAVESAPAAEATEVR